MAKIEKIFGLIVLVSLLLLFLSVPGARFLLVLSLIALSLVYFFFGILVFNKIRVANVFKKSSYKGLSSFEILGSLIFGFTISLGCLGILFKIQNWQGASSVLITGLLCLLINLIIAGMKYFVSHQDFPLKILIRTGIVGGIGLLVQLI